MEVMISLILTLGMLIAVCLVLTGGCIYLWHNGHGTLNTEFLQTSIHATNMKFVWQTAFSFSSLGLIELGLLILVGTQIVRVGLLVWFYSATKDYVFAFISLFILLTLAYSFIWRN